MYSSSLRHWSKALPPHEPHTCMAKLEAPPVAGSFLLRLTLVQELIAWFDDVDEANGCQRVVQITPA